MLGTGNALVTECYNTCFILSSEGSNLLVDGGGGSTILRQIKHAGFTLNDIHDVFITHSHIDHILGIIWVIRIIAQLMNRNTYNGDVNIYSASQTRTATRRDILGFVRTLKLIDSPSLKFSPVAIIHTPTPTKFGSKSKPQPTVYYDDKLFSDTLSSIITSSPMKILAVDKAVDLLSQRGIKVGRNEIISFVKKNFERFRSYSTKNDTLITLAEKK